MSATEANRESLQDMLSRANIRELNLILVFARSLLDKEKTASAVSTDDFKGV